MSEEKNSKTLCVIRYKKLTLFQKIENMKIFPVFDLKDDDPSFLGEIFDDYKVDKTIISEAKLKYVIINLDKKPKIKDIKKDTYCLMILRNSREAINAFDESVNFHFPELVEPEFPVVQTTPAPDIDDELDDIACYGILTCSSPPIKIMLNVRCGNLFLTRKVENGFYLPVLDIENVEKIKMESTEFYCIRVQEICADVFKQIFLKFEEDYNAPFRFGREKGCPFILFVYMTLLPNYEISPDEIENFKFIESTPEEIQMQAIKYHFPGVNFI